MNTLKLIFIGAILIVGYLVYIEAKELETIFNERRESFNSIK